MIKPDAIQAATDSYRKSPIGAALSVLAALLYGASPIDLIPDVLLLLGWVDDAVIIPILLVMAWNLYRKRKKAKIIPAQS